MKRLSQDARLYRAAVDASWQAARQFMPLLDEATFRQRFRLLRLTDHVDSYLTLLRSARWWQRQVDVEGDWPKPAEPYLVLSIHWGAGSWIWKLLRERGISTHVLARKASHADMGSSRIALWYARFRAWAALRIGCAGLIYLGGSAAHMHAAFDAGENVLAMIDLPADPERAAFEKPCHEWTMRFPRGLVDMALASGVGVVLFSGGLDADSGRRNLRIEVLPRELDADAIATRYAAHFSRRLTEQPGYWQLWQVAPALFSTPTIALDASSDE